MVFAFDGLADADPGTLLALFLQNRTRATNRTYLRRDDWDWPTIGSPYLLNLPDGAPQALPHGPPGRIRLPPAVPSEAP